MNHRILTAAAACCIALAASATDMEHKAKTIATVATAHSGTAEVLCDVLGQEKTAEHPPAGLATLPVPASGYAEIEW